MASTSRYRFSTANHRRGSEFLPLLLPALIGGIGSVVSSSIKSSNDRKVAQQQNMLAQEQSDKQYQYDMEAMQLQRQWDLEDRQFAIDNPTVIKGEVDYEKMVASAEKAGINALTALRNGGSAGFSQTSQPSAPLSRTAPTRQAPYQAAMPADNSWAAGVEGFVNNFDPYKHQQNEAQYMLAQAQIRNLNASTEAMKANKPASFNVPTWTASTTAMAGAGNAAASIQSGATGSWDRINSEGLGLSWGVNPANTPAQEIEDQYAELPANIVGTANWIRDMFDEYGGGLTWDTYQLPTLGGIWSDFANRDYNNRKSSGPGYVPYEPKTTGGGGGW